MDQLTGSFVDQEEKSTTEISMKINNFQQSYVNMVKLSVAIAILKKKPASVSASDYTRSLACAHLERMLKLEDKCQEMEKLQQDAQLEYAAAAAVISSYTPNPYADSSIYPTPPCSEEPIENYTATHTVFLQSSYHVKSSLALLEESKLTDKVDQLPLMKSIENSLHFLLAEPTRIRIPNIKRTVDNIISISKNVPPNGDFAAQLVDAVNQFFESFIKNILLNDDVESELKYDYIHLMSQFVCSATLQKTLFAALLKSTSQFSSYLKELCVGLQQTLDPVYFENSYYVMSCLAECLVKAAQQPSDPNTFLKLRERIRTTLENCLSLIVDTFPIFAHSVWYIIALVNNVKLDPYQRTS